ncbi:hypothetical protein RhiirA1_536999 [Rhizophagus irregularis]|uniref:Uncharacterized protein n=2 Tax=Rhizophagus irregularis TaxID=588596 RepID=A0A2N0RMH6_9GLOM|nr:hypothetical protein GLOIN_2v1726140 [Rhizophagus irregularis DAOM 181602=DAOM 197198]PKC64511.1 hypothetical protein RhiirA1_536999 [Rhizophagus irregularis]POG58974.1 hypothetical protein GLOIN_2v1726140 [Rhizophagus irregularis DAOM 181602=DAOM 197198]GET59567.1 hypothetical protein GLOIN_2v1726140 [Rhizophagus irregularis DAOM 181602=DAOM 197198]|eukprot:XP_025165840.1 hypothetical protein GLOIN_2v1726140 [Rhizophagus irregularis DAOM 181602=DAOM 197198]
MIGDLIYRLFIQSYLIIHSYLNSTLNSTLTDMYLQSIKCYLHICLMRVIILLVRS